VDIHSGKKTARQRPSRPAAVTNEGADDPEEIALDLVTLVS